MKWEDESNRGLFVTHFLRAREACIDTDIIFMGMKRTLTWFSSMDIILDPTFLARSVY